MAIQLSYLFAVIAGILTWSLAEYVLHRFLGHELKTNIRFKKEHLKHHFLENYFAPTKIKALIAVIVVFATWMITTPLLGFEIACVYSLSFTVFYLYYEFVHRSLHVKQPKSRWGFFLRQHHLHHHQKGIVANYGVTSPLWDVVFRTYQSPSVTGRASGHKKAYSEHNKSDRQFNEERRPVA